MLAQLLRRVIAIQMILGAGLGCFLFFVFHWPVWTGLVLAFALPPLTSLLTISTSMLRSRDASQPWSLWWRAWAGEYAASVRIFMLRQPWTWGAPALLASSHPSASKVPVVLVHGFICNHRIWDRLAPALRAQGHAVFAVHLEPPFASIDVYTATIERAVVALLQHSGHTQVALIGHSMGGLAIRAWIRRHGSARVARVLTLGTPHAGTKLAKGPVLTTNGAQMVWQSAWLKELAAQEPPAVHALFSVAITRHDNIVYPQTEQTLPGNTPTVFAGIGHLQMCFSPEVQQWVLRELDSLATDA